MKLESILFGRAIRLMRVIPAPGGIHLHTTVQALQERYSFIEVPKTLVEFDETKGVNFRHGKFKVTRQGVTREVVIDTFTVYSNGVVADTRSYTDDAESFLDDVIQWGIKTFGVIVPSNQQIEKYYLSNLEVSLESQLGDFFSLAPLLAKQLSGCLTNYGLKHGPFELASFVMNFDRKELPSIVTNYTLQRREGVAFSSKLYFSSAPLKTEDHISLLQVLDRASS